MNTDLKKTAAAANGKAAMETETQRHESAKALTKSRPALLRILGNVAVLAILLSLSTVCKSSTKQPQLKPLEKLTPVDMTMAKANGLYGKVKTVTTDNSVVEYNEAGELSFTNWKGKNSYTITSEGKTKKFTVKYDGNSRCDQITGTDEDCECDGCQRYIFDNYGRIVSHSYSFGYIIDILSYTYNGADALPSSYNITLYEDSEKITSFYEYPTIDDHGNWTERKTTVVTYSIYWEAGEEVLTEKERNEKPIVEKRTITYYE
jgi:hypothetical protein